MAEMTDAEITKAARALMTEFNRCCRMGSLDGGMLAYTAEGPGEWFTASTRLPGRPGMFRAARPRQPGIEANAGRGEAVHPSRGRRPGVGTRRRRPGL